MNGDALIVFHQGTHAMGRFTTVEHSLAYDYVGYDTRGVCSSGIDARGLEVHVQGMADTGATARNGTVCDVPRLGAKDFSGINDPNPPYSVQSPGNCTSVGVPQNAYEIWTNLDFRICTPDDIYCTELASRFSYRGQVAVRDPITTLDFAHPTTMTPTQTIVNPTGPAWDSPDSAFLGCQLQAYFTPLWESNADAGSSTVYYTNAHTNYAGLGGNARTTQDATHPLRQQISRSGKTDTQSVAFDLNRAGTCPYGVKAPN